MLYSYPVFLPRQVNKSSRTPIFRELNVKRTHMGSQAAQAALWGGKPQDWASIQEATGKPGYDFVLEHLKPRRSDHMLDIGCGSGIFCSMAAASGATITGFDATEPLVQIARKRAPGVTFFVGDMESLPFQDASFDIVTGFNSFQYAASIPAALAEAKRVLKPGGRLAVMIWGNKEDCEAASYLATVGKLLPPPPPGAPGPFALSEGKRLENLLTEAGFKVDESTDIACNWDYPDMDTALTGLLSAGPAIRAINTAGYDTVHAAVRTAAQPYAQPNGHVVYKNTNRIVLATR